VSAMDKRFCRFEEKDPNPWKEKFKAEIYMMATWERREGVGKGRGKNSWGVRLGRDALSKRKLRQKYVMEGIRTCFQESEN